MTVTPEKIDVADVVSDDDLSLSALFETDAVAEEQGRWFNKFMGEHIDMDVKLRSYGSKAALNVLRRLNTANTRNVQADGTLPFEVMNKIQTMVTAEAVIVEWRGKGWRISKDEPILPYTKENALLVLQRFKAVRNRIVNLAGSMDAFRAQETEAAEKN